MIQTQTRPVVLVIEDDKSIRSFLRTGLVAANYLVHEAETGRVGLVEFKHRKPDIIILDLGLPDMAGIDVIRAVREFSLIPIIILSAKSDEGTKIEALDLGADDYLTKPFSYGELLARVRVALRHAVPGVSKDTRRVYVRDSLVVDLDCRTVLLGQQSIHLTPIQFRLLQCLVVHEGKVVTQKHLLREVWGVSHSGNGHYLRIYMSQLRQKLETDPAHPRILITEAGIGYRIVEGVRE